MASDWQKTRVFLRGYFIKGDMRQSLKMLECIEEWHDGQTRNDGTPYIAHPIRVGAYIIALGFDDDDIIAGALGHDVKEDTGKTDDDLRAEGFNEVVISYIDDLTDKENLTEEAHLQLMHDVGRWQVQVIKIADRINNVSDMAGVFKHQRLLRYLFETQEYIYPLVRKARKLAPEHRPKIVLMKYHLESVVDSICAMLPKTEESSCISSDRE